MEVEEIWESFNENLHNYVKRRVLDKSLADDIVQDVFLKVMKNIQKLNEVENIQQYLYKITHNTMVDSFRSRKLVFQELELNTAEHSSHLSKNTLNIEPEIESLNSIVSKSCIKPFIEKLPEKYKTALIAAEINNVTQKELAERFDISYSGAKSRVQRGKEKLKNLLQECCNFKYDTYGNLIKSNKKNCSC